MFVSVEPSSAVQPILPFSHLLFLVIFFLFLLVLSLLFRHLVSSLPPSVLSRNLGCFSELLTFEALISFISDLFSHLLSKSDCASVLPLLDSLIPLLLKEKGFSFDSLLTTHTMAMDTLLTEGKSPLIAHKLTSTINKGALNPHRMQYGLIEHQVNFFNATHINEVMFKYSHPDIINF